MLVLNILYQIFIAPIEMGMQWVLEFSFSKTNSYGLALVILSVVVNIVLLPLYNVAEKWQQEDREKQGRMAKKLKEIKAAFTGQERFMMLQTLYRQNNYHPLLAARNSIGFLIQIPFFFAAFHLLSNYTPLHGQSFGLFADLGKADGLVSFGSWQIHIMPFVMTAVNLASAYIYTTELAKKDKIQLYAFAIFFLVVLYASPVALVFYWTMNNVFSLAKNWVAKNVKQSDIVNNQSTLPLASRHDIGFVILFFLASITGLSIQFSVDLQYSINTTIYLTFFILGIVFLVSQLYLIKTYSKLNRYISGVLIVVIALVYFAKLYKIEQRPLQFLHFVNIFMGLGFLICIKKLNVFNSRFFQFKPEDYNFAISKIAIALFGLIFLVNPFAFFLNDEDLSIDALGVVNLSLNYYVLFTIGFLLIYKVANSAIKKIIASGLIGYTVVYLLLGYVVPINYGDLEDFRFADASRLNITSLQSLLEIAIYSALFVLCFITLNRYTKLYKRVANVLLLFFVVSIAVNFPYDYFHADEKEATSINQVASDNLQAGYELEKKTTLSFSQEKNILVIVLDGYGSGSFAQVLQDDSTIADQLTGFTWYKNTLSTGTSTAASFIALNGGHQYTVESINQRSTHLIQQEAVEAFNIIPNSLKKLDWLISYSKPQYIGTKDLNSDLFGFIDYDYKSHLLNNYDEYKEINISNAEQLMKNEVVKLIMVSGFKGAPLFLRQYLYDGGHWHSRNERAGALKAINYKAKDWGLLTALEDDMNFLSNQPTFKYLWFEVPHRPNAINRDGLLTGVTTNYIESQQVILKLIKILDKIKEAGLYDKTKIIIASDHGLSDQPTINFPDSFEQSIPAGYESKMNTGRVNPLLMVKEFESFKGRLKTSDLLMSNADLPSLICSGFAENCGLKDKDPTKFIQPNRVLRTSTIVRDGFLNQKAFTVTDAYDVQHSLFDPKNWARVGDK